MALYNGVLRETQSGESTTSNATFFLSAGVVASVLLKAVFLPGIGDSAVLGKAVGASTVLINGVDAFICSARIIWFEETRNISYSFTYTTVSSSLFLFSS